MENKKYINTDLSPKAIGPYSQAVLVGDFLFTSGQIPIDPKTNEIISSDFQVQVIQTLKNLKNLISSEKFEIKNIIKITVFLTDLSFFKDLNEIFIKFFGQSNFPARSVVQVVKLPKDSKIEIEAICKK